MGTRSTTVALAALLLLLAHENAACAQARGGRGGAFGGARPAPNISVPHIPNPPPRPAPRPTPAPTPPVVVQRPPALQPGGGLKPTIRPPTPATPPAHVAINPSHPTGSAPTLGGGVRPAPRPLPGGPIPTANLPHPTPGNVGGFIGTQRPVRPVPPAGAPGGNIAGQPTHSPTKPEVVNRPTFNRPTNITHNTVINSRQSWVNINKTQVNAIHNHWNQAIVRPGARPGVGLTSWYHDHPNRVAYWNNWGATVRNHWRGYGNHHNWFNYNWWAAHPHPWAGWHYSNAFGRYPASYWWRLPAWGALTSWFTWAAPQPIWAAPIYYDYGPGGNVVYQDGQVFVGGQDVGTPDEFAQSAADLATVPPPSEEAAQNDQWMPLGTFAMSSSENDTEPQRVLQLAVDQNGIISGTLYNQQTDKTVTVQGQVDKDTQRVAFRFGESDNVVAETGLYNLTQNEVPLLVHYGPTKVENFLLVRLDAPPDEDAGAGP